MAVTVRDAVLEVLRQTGMTRIFANPGSTEVAFLTDLPGDLDFVLALHEGSVVGMASGHALASGRPSLVLLHTTAGLGNAVGALATARTNRAPLVVLVGQQDRRHLAAEPFLAGRLAGLAGEYPVACHQPARPADVPGAVLRAFHEATVHSGPAVVVVPMGDWFEPADDSAPVAAPAALRLSAAADPSAVAALADLVAGAARPALVVGPGADTPHGRDAVALLADALDAPVWQAAFAAQAAFDHASPRFAGHLPPLRSALRAALAGHDLVLVLGAPAFRQGTWDAGPFVADGTRVAVVTPYLDEALHSAAALAVVGPVGATCADLASLLPPRPATGAPRRARATAAPSADGEPLTAAHVFSALADRLPAGATFLEESPSSRGELLARIPAREHFSFLTIAQGGLGFALPAATGIKLARPERPVVALLGDGASLYNIQGLWSASRYGAGVLFIVLSNGGYAVMDKLAAQQGGKPPWPGFGEVSVSRIAEGFGCPARRVESYAGLLAALDEVVPRLGTRTEPLLLDVAVTAGTTGTAPV